MKEKLYDNLHDIVQKNLGGYTSAKSLLKKKKNFIHYCAGNDLSVYCYDPNDSGICCDYLQNLNSF